MELEALNANFAIPGVLVFDQNTAGLIRASITTSAVSAEIYLQGAHLTHWQPSGLDPVLFLSSAAQLLPGTAIRGGIPVIFPWFGAKSFDPEAAPGPQVAPGPYAVSDPPASDTAPAAKPPAHGFARIEPWILAFAAQAGDSVHLTFTLAPSETSRRFGYDHFRLVYTLVIGASLSLSLTVANEPEAPQPLLFEEALHTYFSVADVSEVSVEGLGGITYVDKTEGNAEKCQPAGPVRFTAEGTREPIEVDRPYLDTSVACTLRDPVRRRNITISKSDSLTTVVWNPGPAKHFNDLAGDEWQRFLAIETANLAANRIELAPGRTHTMRASYSVQEAGGAAAWR